METQFSKKYEYLQSFSVTSPQAEGQEGGGEDRRRGWSVTFTRANVCVVLGMRGAAVCVRVCVSVNFHNMLYPAAKS